MCGIAGLLGDFDLSRVRPMTDALRHRGPDDEGFFTNSEHRIALGHRRLSIIDLDSGKQPIFNEDGSVVVIFNGEIYNYVELRRDLEKRGHIFTTNSDTETIVHLYEDHGVSFPIHLNGDFSIALYDLRQRRLVLVRDRLGIRPLYLAESPRGIAFASEPKALWPAGVPRELNHAALASYLRFRYVPGPDTLFRGIRKLLPGHRLVVEGDGRRTEDAYWNPDDIAAIPRSDRACVDEFDALLTDAVRIRMRADVPVSAFLSGGLDSSLIVKLAADHGTVHRAFSVGFNLAIDENAAARSFAGGLEIPHQDIYVARDGYRDLSRIVGRMDEPIGDVIILPTHILSEQSSRETKVTLTGEGADEIWAGYLHHYVLHHLAAAAHFAPGVVEGAGALARAMPLRLLSAIFPYPAALGRKGKDKLVSLLQAARRPRDAYMLFSTFSTAENTRRLLGNPSVPDFPSVLGPLDDVSRSMLRRIAAVERRAWLPDYTLLKQDTLSMANALEGRVPFLDHRIVEFAASLPDDQKIRNLRSKYLLRKVAERHIGSEIAWRKKKAFYIPTEQSFDEGFGGLYTEWFDPTRIRRQGVFDPDVFAEIAAAGSREILDNKLRNNLLIIQMWLAAQGW